MKKRVKTKLHSSKTQLGLTAAPIRVDADNYMLLDELRSSGGTDSCELVAYKHDEHKLYKYHRASNRRWSILVCSVDTLRTDDCAFAGKYLTFATEHKVPKGSIIVEACGECRTAYRITGDFAKTEIYTCFRGAMYRLILAVAKALV